MFDMQPVAEQKYDAETVEVAESDSTLSWTAEEEKRLVRKIDLLLLPCIWLMYLLSYMVSYCRILKTLSPGASLTEAHRTGQSSSSLLNSLCRCLLDKRLTYRHSIGNAKIAGMTDDLALTSNQYSIALVVFFG